MFEVRLVDVDDEITVDTLLKKSERLGLCVVFWFWFCSANCCCGLRLGGRRLKER